MRKFLRIFPALLALTLVAVAPLAQTGCQHAVTLESGGAYSDPALATTDRAILDASHAMGDFVTWQAANATYLAHWPEVAALAEKVRKGRDGWVRSAYVARDAYAQASAAYKVGKQGPPDGSNLRAAMAVLSDLTVQITAFRSSHDN